MGSYPEVGLKLEAQIEDAIEADRLFTMPMDDEVEPRRDFIESNARRAANIVVQAASPQTRCHSLPSNTIRSAAGRRSRLLQGREPVRTTTSRRRRRRRQRFRRPPLALS
ncbi:MAG: hypothetical protein JNL87_02870 [Burkholderiaceae bacterium]|nr:hypothetical protein [Burkholderiaceae bacterium]